MSLINKLKNLYHNQFILSRSFLIIIASFVSNIFAYLFQLICGRYFSTEDYGTIVALFSLSGIIPIFAQFFISGIPKLVAEVKDIDYPHKITDIFYSIFAINTLLTIIVTVIMFLNIGTMAEYLNISDYRIIVAFTLAVSAGILTSFMLPVLQGLLRFKAYSFVSFLTSVTKLLVGFVVVYWALKVEDIFTGLTITTLLIGVFAFWLLTKNIKLKWRSFSKEDMKVLIKYSVGSSLALIGLNLLNTIDVVIVKHFFDPALAGTYGSVSVIGRIIFYAASPVAIVMVPICAQKFREGGNYIKPFFASIGLAFAIAAFSAFIYYEFPHVIITLLFGEKYLAAEPYLGLFGIFMLIYTLIHVFSWFLVSISSFKMNFVILLSAAIQYFGLHMYHESITQVLYVSIFATGIALVIFIFFFIKIYIDHKKALNKGNIELTETA